MSLFYLRDSFSGRSRVANLKPQHIRISARILAELNCLGSSFGSIHFGRVAQAGLSEQLVASDLTVVGSLAGGGALGEVDLIYVPVPEPSTLLLLALGACMLGRLTATQRRLR